PRRARPDRKSSSERHRRSGTPSRQISAVGRTQQYRCKPGPGLHRRPVPFESPDQSRGERSEEQGEQGARTYKSKTIRSNMIYALIASRPSLPNSRFLLLRRLDRLEVELAGALDEEDTVRRLIARGGVLVVSAGLHQVRARSEPELGLPFRSLDERPRHDHD